MEDMNLLTELSSDRHFGDKTDEVLLSYHKDRLNEEIEDSKQDRSQRKIFSFRIFWFMCAYMILSLIVVFCCGIGCMRLSDAVLIALLTTTLANVIGVFNFVAKYLFHK